MYKKILVSTLLMFCVLCYSDSNALATNRIYNNQYTYSRLELNPQLNAVPQNKAGNIANTQVNTTKNNAATNNNQTNNNVQPIVPQKPYSSNVTSKDLTIEGKIEKTQSNSIYYGQTDSELQELVNDIGRNLMTANSINRNVTFKYTNKDVENANVNINNTVTVYKGLIKSCYSMDELAYVIGHELGHASNYHVVKGVGVGAASTAVNYATAYGIGKATDNVWAQAGVLVGTGLATKYGSSKISRNFENTADLTSIDYIVKAGYNPLAALAIMNKIGSTYLDVLSDHPSTEKRLATMYNYIQMKYPQYLDAGYDSKYYKDALIKIELVNRKKQQ